MFLNVRTRLCVSLWNTRSTSSIHNHPDFPSGEAGHGLACADKACVSSAVNGILLPFSVALLVFLADSCDLWVLSSWLSFSLLSVLNDCLAHTALLSTTSYVLPGPYSNSGGRYSLFFLEHYWTLEGYIRNWSHYCQYHEKLSWITPIKKKRERSGGVAQ